jgi:DNA-binding NtrC family response regulator
MQLLLAYHGPGNVRELKNAIEYLAATGIGTAITPEEVEAHLNQRPVPGVVRQTKPTEAKLSAGDDGDPTSFRPLKEEIRELEQTRIEQALAAAGGNQTHAAKLISMPLRTFVAKMKKYDIG